MVVTTSQAKKIFKNLIGQTHLWIVIQVPLKPNLASYEAQLKNNLLPMSLMFFKRYNKNYNNRMSIEEVVMNMTNECHMNLLTMF